MLFFLVATCSILLGDITSRNCNSAYANRTHLKTHFLDDSPMNANQSDCKMYSCTRCQRKYMSRKTLNRHMNHECGKDKVHTCSVCVYRTYRNDRLLSHMRLVHPSIAPLPMRRPLSKIPKIVKVGSITYKSF
jgi:hypothetical protein